MNRIFRKYLLEIAGATGTLKEELKDILEAEKDYRNNIPDNLKCTEMYEKELNACSNLAYAVDYLDDAIECILSSFTG